jgi:hypothetical protein
VIRGGACKAVRPGAAGVGAAATSTSAISASASLFVCGETP